ncbi:MAG: hypothetical protein PHY12_13095 [Eubacteriales bacterium]|nr:hypothetical protein [Eubacteriales bacterium]
MIASERKTAASTIRIHDEAYASNPGQFLPRLNEIVSNSYKRRSRTRAASRS